MQLQLPTLQNWSCHNCGGCCRQHAVEVTDAEQQRIRDQHWEQDETLDWSGPLFEVLSGPPWKRRYRLAQREDGACIFLDEQGLCRIHGKFGEQAKPLACRIYPYAFHPAGKKVAVGLRFSCPSVVANRGAELAEQQRGIKHLAKQVVPEGFERTRPPAVHSNERLDWSDFLKIVSTIDMTLSKPDRPPMQRVLCTLSWIELLGQSKFERIRGARLDEYLPLIVSAAEVESEHCPLTAEPLDRICRTQFRLRLATLCRKDVAGAQVGWRQRWDLLKTASRFATGAGQTPQLHPDLPPVPFADLERQQKSLPAESEELLLRYLRVKVQGLHFCGPAFYGVSLVEGFQSLALTVPLLAVIARWHALGQGQSAAEPRDFEKAVEILDHNYGYSDALGTAGSRRSVQLLARDHGIQKLLIWHCGIG